MIEVLLFAFCAFGSYKIWHGSSSITARLVMFAFVGLIVMDWFSF
jgi:hypothetical protein